MGQKLRYTDLPHDLIIFENAPLYVDGVVVPVGPGHPLIYLFTSQQVSIRSAIKTPFIGHSGCGARMGGG
jgi:hypothetical protein